MKKRILHIGLLLVLCIVIIVTMFKVASMYANASLKNVYVKNENELRFVTDTYISEQVRNSTLVKSHIFKDMNIDSMERYLSRNKFIENVDVIKTYSYEEGRMTGGLVVNIAQRRPIVRVKTSTDDYFLDKDGTRLDRVELFATPVLLASGNIDETFARENVVPLVNFIDKSDFWSSQVSQVYVDKNKDIGLVMIFGAQLVVVGDASMLKEKFENLWSFYKDPVAASNMSKYKIINLKYDGQVVCSKKDM
ncbi:MAG: cell division protein FtsQ/DivIB [Bacteroidales bacterium]